MPRPLLRPHLTLLNISLLGTSLGLLTLTYPSLRTHFLTPTRTMSSQSSSSKPPKTYTTTPYTPRHTSFPYTTADLTPSDTSPDTTFYSSPRYVTHIDSHAIAALADYYSVTLPARGKILDLCSSWISHFPSNLEQAVENGALEVAGVGMSGKEMERNGLLRGRWKVWDLNAQPAIPLPSELFSSSDSQAQLDATTCVVSIDYLTTPLAVLQSIFSHTISGGTVHLIISNRCFPTKAVRRWLRISEAERLQMVGDYLWFAGWRDIEILVLSDGTMEGDAGGEDGVSGFMRLMGMVGGGCDPLWVVRGRKVEGPAK